MRERINRIAELVKADGGLVSFDPNIRGELLKGESLDDVIGTVLSLSDILLPGRESFSVSRERDRSTRLPSICFRRRQKRW